jgi:hypothetical protein
MKIIFIHYIMSLTGGKRKVNKSLKAWVAFVKKVQKEEKLSYKDAIHRAKQRKDKGEKWMKGGDNTATEKETTPDESVPMDVVEDEPVEDVMMDVEEIVGGRRRRRGTMRRSRGRGRGKARSMRRSRGRSARRY